MEKLDRSLPLVKFEQNYPVKVLMYGEGAFLRAFACYAFEVLNEQGLFGGSVAIIQPIPEGNIEKLREQDGLYTVISRGLEGGEKVVKTKLITCVRDYINPYENFNQYMNYARNPELRFVVSNTTEAGISYFENDKFDARPQVSFPGKVTAFLYERFTFFRGDREKGLTFLPCELIDDNGKKLKELVQKYAVEWNLGDEFLTWVDDSCFFANTLVDRIVAGYPHSEAKKLHDELGYCDELLDTSELFFFWAIEGPPELREKLPFDKAGLNVIFSDDITPYRLRKVRLLNGAHSCIAPVALLCGVATVGDAVSDETLRKFIRCVLFDEIIPSLDINKNVLEYFANSVIERFSNPFINHELQSIMLNCVSKIEARLLPIIADYLQKYGRFPPLLIFAISAYVEFYKKEINKVNEIFSLLIVELENAVCEAHCAIGANGIKSEILRLINDKN